MTMRYTVSITEVLLGNLTDAVFAVNGIESAAYLLCGVASMEEETRLLGRDIIPVRPEHYLKRTSDRLSIASDSYASVAKRGRENAEAVVFVHSHPEATPGFSPKDDQEEPKLMEFLASRAPAVPHGSIIFNTREHWQTRIWTDEGWHSVSRFRVVGQRLRYLDFGPEEDSIPEFFDRHVRAFGPDIQRLLQRLHVGVVGAGGTGSAVIEQLTRLGIGRISVFDGDTLEGTNVTRVYGSVLADAGKNKAVLQNHHVLGIGLDTQVVARPKHITVEATAKHLRECDVVFGCTDLQQPRAILMRLALRYLIPVFDLAVKVDASEGMIRGIWGRVTTLLPGEACLFCRGRIDPETLRAEGLPPDQLDQEIKEGYIRGLTTEEPAVVMFTTAVAAQGVQELLHRLTGFMGNQRQSTEVLMCFSECRVRTNRQKPSADCICQQRTNWGRGDTSNFLGMVW